MIRRDRPFQALAASLLLGVLAFPPAGAQSRPAPAAANKPAAPPSAAESKAAKAAAVAQAHEKEAVEKDARSQKQWIKVVVTSSRPEIARGAEWGVTADITNTSTAPISINPAELQLVVQPEVRHDDRFCPDTREQEELVLQPQTHFMFSWHPCPPPAVPLRERIHHLLRDQVEYLSFVPGPYIFTVEGKVHLYDSPLYHTFAESIPVKLSLEQLTMSCWAGIGAVLAYLVTAFRRAANTDDSASAARPGGDASPASLGNRLASSLRVGALPVFAKLASAFLLGAALSVVSNRLADTSFPVKVSVNDVWGAISVGFVFYFIGNKLIDKLVASISDAVPADRQQADPASKRLRPQSPLHEPGSQTA